MISGIEILAALTTGLAGLGLAESTLHKRRLGKIPIRIHVSGTRGKSSLTRLLAAGMNGAGIRTAAKTTGTLARMILPDSREVPVFRPAGANIIEQKRIVAVACDLNVEALVIECMALNPKLHWISESQLVKATHGVITNARADHLDVMGPTDRHVAQCLAGMIPIRGKLFTAESKHLEIIEAACRDRGTTCAGVTGEDAARITREELSNFKYLEHAENVALALRVLEDLGIDRQTALEGMWRTRPDPGALTEHELDFFGRRITFVNAFAANDPESTKRIWDQSVSVHKDIPKTIALFNLRGDRPDRTRQMALHSSFWYGADHIVLMGSGAYTFSRLAAKRDFFDSGKLVFADFERVDEIFETIVGTCGDRALVVGMGNIGGLGLSLTNYFKNRSILQDLQKEPS